MRGERPATHAQHTPRRADSRRVNPTPGPLATLTHTTFQSAGPSAVGYHSASASCDQSLPKLIQRTNVAQQLNNNETLRVCCVRYCRGFRRRLPPEPGQRLQLQQAHSHLQHPLGSGVVLPGPPGGPDLGPSVLLLPRLQFTLHLPQHLLLSTCLLFRTSQLQHQSTLLLLRLQSTLHRLRLQSTPPPLQLPSTFLPFRKSPLLLHPQSTLPLLLPQYTLLLLQLQFTLPLPQLQCSPHQLLLQNTCPLFRISLPQPQSTLPQHLLQSTLLPHPLQSTLPQLQFLSTCPLSRTSQLLLQHQSTLPLLPLQFTLPQRLLPFTLPPHPLPSTLLPLPWSPSSLAATATTCPPSASASKRSHDRAAC
ncbi:uncharacterized protein [Drosophila bipectinata]|uniref:uncharacterized protein n=1 Tax=Drosophila bipectinata TaxID=42026 RepID=UPI0038B406E7